MLANRLPCLFKSGNFAGSVWESGSNSSASRCRMTVLPVLWIVWGVVAAILLILLGYRGTLTRYEEDQIFLDQATSLEAREQSDIQRKLEKIRPYLVGTLWVIGALTVAILGLYVQDAIQRLM